MEGFEVVRRLGQGSFGSVMKVVRRADGCEYAMKRVPIAQMGDREIADALNECRVLASVRATQRGGVVGARAGWRVACVVRVCVSL